MKLIEVDAKLHEFEEFEKTFQKDEILEIYYIIENFCNILIILQTSFFNFFNYFSTDLQKNEYKFEIWIVKTGYEKRLLLHS